ncbi:hypothetical protein ACFL6S_04060 [Candidatus Poribacteria bacterium]
MMDTNEDTNNHELWLYYTSSTVCASIIFVRCGHLWFTVRMEKLENLDQIKRLCRREDAQVWSESRKVNWTI